MGVRVLRTPVRAPQANGICERFGGSRRRECLDYLIPFHERHLNWIVRSWIRQYNETRPHMSLGPGIPAPARPAPPAATNRHTMAAGHTVKSRPILGGLHHAYWLERAA